MRRQCGLMLQLLQQLVRPITSIFCYLFTYVLHSPIGFNNVLHFNALWIRITKIGISSSLRLYSQEEISHDVMVVTPPVIRQKTGGYHNDGVISVAVVTCA